VLPIQKIGKKHRAEEHRPERHSVHPRPTHMWWLSDAASCAACAQGQRPHLSRRQLQSQYLHACNPVDKDTHATLPTAIAVTACMHPLWWQQRCWRAYNPAKGAHATPHAVSWGCLQSAPCSPAPACLPCPCLSATPMLVYHPACLPRPCLSAMPLLVCHAPAYLPCYPRRCSKNDTQQHLALLHYAWRPPSCSALAIQVLTRATNSPRPSMGLTLGSKSSASPPWAPSPGCTIGLGREKKEIATCKRQNGSHTYWLKGLFCKPL